MSGTRPGEKYEIGVGPLAAAKWGTWSFLTTGLGLALFLPDPTTAANEPIAAGLGWFLLACGLLFGFLAVRSYRWYRAKTVMLTLTPQGIQGRPTQGILVPWPRVTSVRRVTRRPSTIALDVQSFWLGYLVSAADPFRYDAYEVKLDWALLKEKGVKGEHAFGIGFDIIPALMSFSSVQVAQAFSRWLPAERRLDFENRADPVDAAEFRDRLVDTGALLAAAGVADMTSASTEAAPGEDAAPVEETRAGSDSDAETDDDTDAASDSNS